MKEVESRKRGGGMGKEEERREEEIKVGGREKGRS